MIKHLNDFRCKRERNREREVIHVCYTSSFDTDLIFALDTRLRKIVIAHVRERCVYVFYVCVVRLCLRDESHHNQETKRKREIYYSCGLCIKDFYSNVLPTFTCNKFLQDGEIKTL